MPTASNFNTAQGQALYSSFGNRLQKQLTENRRNPVAQIAAWSSYRESISAARLDGLPGSGGVYHVEEVARYILAALDTVIGGAAGQFVEKRERPIAALGLLSKGFGFRYMKGATALHFALADAGCRKLLLNDYKRQRESFQKRFTARLVAAYAFNDNGQHPDLALELIHDFAQEVLGLCDWISQTAERSRAPLVEAHMKRVLQKRASD